MLYIHLDRKDRKWRVAKELRDLGISKEDSQRLILRTAEDIQEAKTFDDRLAWLKKEVIDAAPHLVVIDLMWQTAIEGGRIRHNNANKVLKRVPELVRRLTLDGTRIRYELLNAGRAYLRYMERV